MLATINVSHQALGPDLGWPMDFHKRYLRGKLIGTGSFGCVYLGIDMRTGKEVAVKVMPKVRGKLTKDRTLQKLDKEVSIMRRLQDSPNVIRLDACFESETEVYLVTEFCEGGDLQRLSDGVGAFNERAIALIGFEILKVVKACHDCGVIHGDIKPANFVLKYRYKNPLASADAALSATAWLKAIDFGCSQLIEAGQRFSKRTGTPVYMAPEIFERDYGHEADLWGLGMMLYQLYARRFPYWETMGGCRNSKLEEVAACVLDRDISFDYGPWKHISSEGLNFIGACLEKNYLDRIDVDEALKHAWFRKYLSVDEYQHVVTGNIVPKAVAVKERQPLL